VIDLEAHRTFLDRSYRFTRPVYDATRKHYLFGRDRVLTELLAEPWDTLVEIGPGTGRNLSVLHAARPTARLGGIEPCDPMLAHARRRLPDVRFVRGFAETTDPSDVLGGPVDRILFSYCLSMVADPGVALDVARRALTPLGQIVVVDFGDLSGLPSPARKALRQWLRLFHVEPLDPELLRVRGGQWTYGAARWYLVGRLSMS
jgi:S-adenosylmethionine-diacylgycerolhomoserine-N-methlytransferase